MEPNKTTEPTSVQRTIPQCTAHPSGISVKSGQTIIGSGTYRFFRIAESFLHPPGGATTASPQRECPLNRVHSRLLPSEGLGGGLRERQCPRLGRVSGMIRGVGPLEHEIAGLLKRPAEAPDRDWVQGDGHPPDADVRVSLIGLSEEQRDEYLFVRVNALGDALRRIAQAIDELRGESDSGD